MQVGGQVNWFVFGEIDYLPSGVESALLVRGIGEESDVNLESVGENSQVGGGTAVREESLRVGAESILDGESIVAFFGVDVGDQENDAVSAGSVTGDEPVASVVGVVVQRVVGRVHLTDIAGYESTAIW